MKEFTLAFIGNPNCGKTTLFNVYTGAGLKVANRPGVTVEKAEGKIRFRGRRMKLVDLPGVYSLSSCSPEERVSREYIAGGGADVIIDVIDASNLERNLYLALQLIELGKPVVLALNMWDIAEKRGIKPDCRKLEKILGTAAVPVSARKRKGLDELLSAADEAAENAGKPEMSTVYSGEDEEKTISERYAFIEKIIYEAVPKSVKEHLMTDRADAVLTHPLLGMPIFLLIMVAVFFLTFEVGDRVKLFFENWLESFTVATAELLLHLNVNDVVSDLITEGIIAGVGGVLTFLPNIFILFLALAFLEDSGYMARAAYVTDGVMRRLGLSGRAFIPLMLGLGCSVPAIMATRTLESRYDRLKTIMMIPFVSCSAKLPIYVMLSGIFFGKYALFAAYSMYLIGFAAAFLAAYVISKTTPESSLSCLLEELPDYRIPDLCTVSVYVWEKLRDYLTKAGTTIFIASVILWFLLNFGFDGREADMSKSFCADAAKVIVPLMSAAGLGYWKIIVSLIAGIAAKEMTVSAMSMMYGIANISSAEGKETLAELLMSEGFTALNAYSMMLFCLLYVPCIASLAAIRRETNSVKTTICIAALQLALAWVAAVVFYQLGGMIF